MRPVIPLLVCVAACASASPAPAGGGNPGPADGTDDEAAGAEPNRPDQDRQGAPAGPGGEMAGMLEAHNRLRKKHCVPPLTWSPELARQAQSWSDRIASRGCQLQHAQGVAEGENLAWIAPVGAADAADIARRWYDEVADYDFDDPTFSMETGHFTQLVWAATERLGCGVAVCNDGNLWTCRYSPPGNVQGEFEENVNPPCD